MTATIEIPSTAHPWNVVYALAESVEPESWLLAGGLMVQLHAMLGGLETRATTDADVLVDLMADRHGVRRLKSILDGHGFTVIPGTLTGYSTRMINPHGDVIDLLVADHLPTRLGNLAMLSDKPMLAMPGRAQAVKRSTVVTLSDGSRMTAVRIPDLLGALILKSAAFSADHAGYGVRHLYDAALLASLIDDPDVEIQRLHSKMDRRRLRVLREHITSDSDYWSVLDEEHRRSGIDTIETLAAW